MRDLNKEFQDTEVRKYAYNFDYILRNYMIKTFKPFFAGLDNALEMGCYHGEFTKKILPYFKSITVLEGSSDLIKIASDNINNNNVKFINSMFEDWESEHKYDAIFLVHTLEHLDDPIFILNKISNSLSKNGKLFLVVPNANAASRQIAVSMDLIPFNAAVTEGEFSHGHRVTYSFDTLENDVKSSGLEIITKTGIFFKPFANFQFEKMIENNVIDESFLDGCYNLGFKYPDLTASIFLLCGKKNDI